MTGVLDVPRIADPGIRGFIARHWPLVVTLAVAVVYLTTVVLLHSAAVSPIDEVVYIDYLEKLWRQGVIHNGEYLGELARSLYACHGVIPFGRMGPECGVDLSDPSAFPYGGFSSPPVQFWITRVVGDVLGLIPGVGQLAGWRLVSVLWLVVGLVFSYLCLRRLRVTGWAFVAVSLAIVASPIGYWSFSFVSTDAPMFGLGAILLWLAMRRARGVGSGWWLVLVAAIGAAFKPTIIVAVGLVSLYLLLHWAIARRGASGAPRGAAMLRSLASRMWPPLAAIVATLVVQYAWARIAAAIWVPSPTTSPGQGVEVPLSFDLVATQFTNFLGGTMHVVVPEVDTLSRAFLPLGWLLIAGVVGAVLLLPSASSDRALSISVLIAFIVAAPALTLAIVLTTGSIFPLPPRYGIALLPGMLAVTVPLLKNRWAIRALLVYVALLLVLWLGLSVVFARWFA